MAKLAVIIVIVAISSLSTSSSEECQSSLSKESFSCCLYNIDLVDYTKCQFETENCSAGIDWTRSEDDCGTLNENTMEFGNSFVKCHGRKDLQSPDTNFKWTCPKPDTGNVKAEIILAPETGTLELTGDDFRFTSTLANAFPVPQSDLKFDQETACLEKKTSNVHMNKSGLITVTDHFLVRVKAEVADVKVIVIQEGFDNRTFDYMLSYPDFASGGNNTDGNDGPNVTGIVLGVLIPVCILIGGGVAAYICYKRRLLCFATPATRVVGHTSQMDRTANRYRERNEYVTSAPPSGSGMVNPSFDDSNYVEIDLNDSGEGVANLNNSRTSGPMSDYVSRVAARYYKPSSSSRDSDRVQNSAEINRTTIQDGVKLFPMGLERSIDEEFADEDPKSTGRCRSLEDFFSNDSPGLLSVQKGEELTIIQMDLGSGWTCVEGSNGSGFVPTSLLYFFGT